MRDIAEIMKKCLIILTISLVTHMYVSDHADHLSGHWHVCI